MGSAMNREVFICTPLTFGSTASAECAYVTAEKLARPNPVPRRKPLACGPLVRRTS